MKILFTLFSLLSVCYAMASNVYGFAGAGTESAPYQISKAADFMTLASEITADNTAAGEYFIVTQDIDFGGTADSPVQLPSIGKAAINLISEPISWGFRGILDGNGMTISGIYHTNCGNDGSGKFNALFSALYDGGVIKNLIFGRDNYIKSYYYSSPFVSVNSGGLIENCVNSADVTTVGAFASGICTYIVGGKGTIRNCTNNGSITAASFAVGILAGSQSNTVIGKTDASYVNVVVEDCLNTGNCSSTNGIGSAGIVGSFSGRVVGCENRGMIDDSNGTAKTIQYTGGVASSLLYVTECSGNVNYGIVKGVNYVGGVIGCIAAGSDEPLELFGNVNMGTVSGSGENIGDVIGGSKRSKPIVTEVGKVTVRPKVDDNAPRYNLGGQRINKEARGLVIVNGRKYIQK